VLENDSEKKGTTPTNAEANESDEDQSSNEESEKDEVDVDISDEEVEEDAFSEEDRSQGKQSSSGGRFECGGGLLNSVANPYKHTLQDIFQPTGNKVETTTVLLNDLYEALMKGHTIDHIPTSKKYLEVGYMLLKLFINHKEVLLTKTQHQLLNMQCVLAFVQGRQGHAQRSCDLNPFSGEAFG
jgi:hypothetical protein